MVLEFRGLFLFWLYDKKRIGHIRLYEKGFLVFFAYWRCYNCAMIWVIHWVLSRQDNLNDPTQI